MAEALPAVLAILAVSVLVIALMVLRSRRVEGTSIETQAPDCGPSSTRQADTSSRPLVQIGRVDWTIPGAPTIGGAELTASRGSSSPIAGAIDPNDLPAVMAAVSKAFDRADQGQSALEHARVRM